MSSRSAPADRRNTAMRAFLPHVQAIQESPPNPAGRAVLWTIMLAVVCLLAWSVFSRVEVVAVTQGKVIGSDRTKVIQPLEPSVVRRIHVREGQAVRAGDVLIELDSTQTRADVAKTHDGYWAALLEAERSRAVLESARHGRLASMRVPAGAPAHLAAAERDLMSSQFNEHRSRLAALDAETVRRQAELNSARQLVAKLEQTLPIATQRANDMAKLSGEGFISRHGYLEREQARIETARDLDYQRGRIEELAAALAEGRQRRRALVAEFERSTTERMADARKRADQLEQDSIKAGQRQQLTRLTAPTDGTVQQLAIHTEGGVVQEAQALMQIVPSEESTEIETVLENKDVGFVRVGMPVTVKLETFPFTKYGTLPGTVSFVAQDAVSDERRGLVFTTRVKLDQATIRVGGRDVMLSPGMAATAEIKIRERRVIEYFLAPVLETSAESLRER